MDTATRNLVRDRAGNQCEYCLIRQDNEPFYRFHIEHVLPRQHGGSDAPETLALACHSCNLHKGPNLTAIDPDTNAIVALFNPRTSVWLEQFALRDRLIVGLTPTGRATAQLLQMNTFARLELRQETNR